MLGISVKSNNFAQFGEGPLMNEDSAETSQIGMNFAANKPVVTDRSGQGIRASGAAKFMPIWLVSAESSFINEFRVFS